MYCNPRYDTFFVLHIGTSSTPPRSKTYLLRLIAPGGAYSSHRQSLASELELGLFVQPLSSCILSASVLHQCPIASRFWGVPSFSPLEDSTSELARQCCLVLSAGCGQSSPIFFSKSVHLPVVVSLAAKAPHWEFSQAIKDTSQATLYESLDPLECLSCPPPRLRSIEEN